MERLKALWLNLEWPLMLKRTHHRILEEQNRALWARITDQQHQIVALRARQQTEYKPKYGV